MTSTTKNEKALLIAIAHHEMCPANGITPETIGETGTYCWVDDFADAIDLTIPQTKGVLGSLVAKDLLVINFGGTEDAEVDFTPEGFAEFLVANAAR
jgi:hypothetical protein